MEEIFHGGGLKLILGLLLVFVFEVNNIYEEYHQIFECQRKHPVDCLIILGTRASRSAWILSHFIDGANLKFTV